MYSEPQRIASSYTDDNDAVPEKPIPQKADHQPLRKIRRINLEKLKKIGLGNTVKTAIENRLPQILTEPANEDVSEPKDGFGKLHASEAFKAKLPDLVNYSSTRQAQRPTADFSNAPDGKLLSAEERLAHAKCVLSKMLLNKKMIAAKEVSHAATASQHTVRASKQSPKVLNYLLNLPHSATPSDEKNVSLVKRPSNLKHRKEKPSTALNKFVDFFNDHIKQHPPGGFKGKQIFNEDRVDADRTFIKQSNTMNDSNLVEREKYTDNDSAVPISPQDTGVPAYSEFNVISMKSSQNIDTGNNESTVQNSSDTRDLIVLEDKILSQDEKIDLTTLGFDQSSIQNESTTGLTAYAETTARDNEQFDEVSTILIPPGMCLDESGQSGNKILFKKKGFKNVTFEPILQQTKGSETVQQPMRFKVRCGKMSALRSALQADRMGKKINSTLAKDAVSQEDDATNDNNTREGGVTHSNPLKPIISPPIEREAEENLSQKQQEDSLTSDIPPHGERTVETATNEGGEMNADDDECMSAVEFIEQQSARQLNDASEPSYDERHSETDISKMDVDDDDDNSMSAVEFIANLYKDTDFQQTDACTASSEVAETPTTVTDEKSSEPTATSGDSAVFEAPVVSKVASADVISTSDIQIGSIVLIDNSNVKQIQVIPSDDDSSMTIEYLTNNIKTGPHECPNDATEISNNEQGTIARESDTDNKNVVATNISHRDTSLKQRELTQNTADSENLQLDSSSKKPADRGLSSTTDTPDSTTDSLTGFPENDELLSKDSEGESETIYVTSETTEEKSPLGETVESTFRQKISLDNRQQRGKDQSDTLSTGYIEETVGKRKNTDKDTDKIAPQVNKSTEEENSKGLSKVNSSHTVLPHVTEGNATKKFKKSSDIEQSVVVSLRENVENKTANQSENSGTEKDSSQNEGAHNCPVKTNRKRLRKTLDVMKETNKNDLNSPSDSDSVSGELQRYNKRSSSSGKKSAETKYDLGEIRDFDIEIKSFVKTEKSANGSGDNVPTKDVASRMPDQMEVASASTRSSVFSNIPLKKRWDLGRKAPEETDVTDDTSPADDEDDDAEDAQRLPMEALKAHNSPKKGISPRRGKKPMPNVASQKHRQSSSQEIDADELINSDAVPETPCKSEPQSRAHEKPEHPFRMPSEMQKRKRLSSTNTGSSAEEQPVSETPKSHRTRKSLKATPLEQAVYSAAEDKRNCDKDADVPDKRRRGRPRREDPEQEVLKSPRIKTAAVNTVDIAEEQPVNGTLKSHRTRKSLKATPLEPAVDGPVDEMQNCDKDDEVPVKRRRGRPRREDSVQNVLKTPKIKTTQVNTLDKYLHSSGKMQKIHPESPSSQVNESEVNEAPDSIEHVTAKPETLPKKQQNGKNRASLTASEGKSRGGNTQTFNPRLLLVRTRAQLESSDVLTEYPEHENVKGKLKCGLCFKNVNPKLWTDHLNEHYGIGWVYGKTAINVNDRSIVLSTLITHFKSNPSTILSCRMCPGQYRSALGLLQHLEMCGAAPQRVNCPFCGKNYSKLSLPVHQRVCGERTKSSPKDSDNTQEIAIDTDDLLNKSGRLKRNSSRKAENKLKTLIAADAGANNSTLAKFFKFYNNANCEKYRKRWENDIQTDREAACPFKACKFRSSEISAMAEHVKSCKFWKKPGYHCRHCKKVILKTVSEAMAHAKQKHQATVDSDFDDNDDNYSDDMNSATSSDPNISTDLDSDALDDENQKTRKTKRGTPVLQNKIYAHRSNNVWSMVKRKWTEFTQRHYDTSSLPKWLAPSYFKAHRDIFSQFMDIPMSPMKCAFNQKLNFVNSKYLPQNGQAPSSGWTTLKRFETFRFQESCVMYVGGSVKALRWIPLPKRVKEQYLAVVYREDMDDYTEYLEPMKKSSFILLFAIPATSSDGDDGETPRDPQLNYIIHVPEGPVHDIAFMPSGAYDEDANRLALMAVGTVAGSINVYVLPINVENVESSQAQTVKVIELKPAYELSSEFNTRTVDTQCLSIRWSETMSHNYIFASFANGYIGIWNISEDENLNRLETEDGRICYVPLCFFYIGEKTIRAFGIHYDTCGPRWIAVITANRKFIVYDIRDMTRPIIVKAASCKTSMNSMDWSPVWGMIPVGYSDTMQCGRSLIVMNPLNVMYHNIKVDNMLSGVSSIHYTPWLNVFACGTDTGDLVFLNPREFHFEDILVSSMKHAKAVALMKIESLTDEPIHSASFIAERAVKPPESSAVATDAAANIPDTERNAASRGWQMFDDEYACKYGLVFGPTLKYQLTHKEDYYNVVRKPGSNLNRYLRITSTRFNMNVNSEHLIGVGYENGFLRISDFRRSSFF